MINEEVINNPKYNDEILFHINFLHSKEKIGIIPKNIT